MAVWIEFTADWDFRPHPSEVHAYKLGSRVYVPENIADQAIEARVAALIETPNDIKSSKAPGAVKKIDASPAAATEPKKEK